MTAHPFKKWLVQQHGKADTAVGDLARDVRLDPGFPTRGERRDLRNYLAECGAESDALVTFEEAWALYEPDGSPADHPFVTWLLRRDLRPTRPWRASPATTPASSPAPATASVCAPSSRTTSETTPGC